MGYEVVQSKRAERQEYKDFWSGEGLIARWFGGSGRVGSGGMSEFLVVSDDFSSSPASQLGATC